jgi:hypothetical protein
MYENEIMETVVYAAAEAWNEMTNEDVRRGVASVLGKVLSPDTDSEFQIWLAGLVLDGIK